MVTRKLSLFTSEMCKLRPRNKKPRMTEFSIKTPLQLTFQAAFVFVFMGCMSISHAQEYVPFCVGFYNVENLFDCEDDPAINDEEYMPDSKKRWNAERYQAKLTSLAQVISEMGTEIHPMGMQILGLSEVENRGVIEDLIATPALAQRNYDIVHYDSPDKRGIDVALIYQPEFFKVYNSKSYELTVPGRDDFFSRDQLLVSGVTDGDTVHVIVAHWPSRSGGEKRSQPSRIEAGKLGRHIVDSLLSENANARIVYMGDLNDDPVNASVKRFLKSDGRKDAAVGDMLYNPMVDLYNKGVGTLAWRDSWNLFDQTILSPGLVSGEGGSYRFFGAKVFNKPYLRQQDGNFAGYPFRTYVGNNYRGGYSDHFPVYVILVREAE